MLTPLFSKYQVLIKVTTSWQILCGDWCFIKVF